LRQQKKQFRLEFFSFEIHHIDKKILVSLLAAI
jgi:hypothetical protein